MLVPRIGFGDFSSTPPFTSPRSLYLDWLLPKPRILPLGHLICYSFGSTGEGGYVDRVLSCYFDIQDILAWRSLYTTALIKVILYLT